MRVLCVGRHALLSAHLASLFRDFGAETCAAVGLGEAVDAARSFAPTAVVCDYELLATVSLTAWEQDPLLSRLPIVAVSLTRRPEEVHVLDVNNVTGFVYLPTLELEDGRRLLAAVCRPASAPPSLPTLPSPPRARRDTPESASAC